MDPYKPPVRSSEVFPSHTSSRLTTSDFLTPNVEQNGESVSTPRSRARSRTLIVSQAALPFKSPTSDKSSSSEVARLASLTSDNPSKVDKARQETRKLLGHIINELQRRQRPPPVWDLYKSENVGIGMRKTDSAKDHNNSVAVKDKPSRTRSLPLVDSDSDDEFSSLFSPDVTFDLLSRLKDLLLLSKLKEWQVFDDGINSNDFHSEEKPSSFRFRRSSFQSSGRSRSFSPNRSSRKASSGLLGQFISILASIVFEDCRFQFNSLRMARPPNALQALTLDISLILVNLYRGNAKVLYDIGLAIVPAFSSFPESMHGRLLNFFEDGMLRSMLQDLSRIQRGLLAPLDVPSADDYDSEAQALPIVAIQVDEAKDESFTSPSFAQGWQQWCPPNMAFQGILSSNTPAQSLEIYYLSSLVGPLLAAILDNVDLSTQDLVLSHRLHRFFHFLTECKSDMSLDLLEVVAYHSTQARYFAMSLLQTFWPNAVGHLCISTPFPFLKYSESFQATGLQRNQQGVGHIHFHQFVPWYFSPPPSSVLFEGSSLHDCHSCSKQINGFGLLCPFCMCAVHSNCYDAPDGSILFHYPLSNDPGTQKVAVHRFSYVRPRKLGSDEVLKRAHHSFRLANIFTLSLCGVCHVPLWGYIAQGYRCGTCNQYTHSNCLYGEAFDRLPGCLTVPDTSRITTTFPELRSSFMHFYRDLLLQEKDLPNCTQEVLSVYWSVLWTQQHLLKSGIASGSIIVTQDRSSCASIQEGDVDDFELQQTVKLYQEHLDSRLEVIPMFQDLLQTRGHEPRFHSILFDWSILLYITSVIKSPVEEDGIGKAFLNVAPPRDVDESGDYDLHSAEIVSLAYVRDALGHQFGLIQTQAACIMLGHLRHLGFFDSMNFPEGFLRSCDRPLETECSFVLPLGLDSSANVESLVTAVERCLEDLNISMNESGFLLLTRRLWPNGMASDYALARLTKSVLAWILAEDDKLVIIMREYVAKNKSLPVSSGSINNGNDYVTCRKALLVKYASRWLFALHCQDPEFYTSLLFNTVSDIAKDSTENLNDLELDGARGKAEEPMSLWTDKVLRFIMKISQSSVAFSVGDDLLLMWLEVVPDLSSSHKPLPTVPRLLNRETEGTARWTTSFDATITSFEHVDTASADPWRIVTGIASRDYEGLRKGLSWLRLFSLSGVDIPVQTFLQVSALVRDMGGSFEDYAVLAEAVFMATYVKSLGKQDLHRMISDLHNRNANYILGRIGSDKDNNEVYRFVRHTLSTILLLCGFERARLQDIGLIEESDIEGLPSRRKVVRRDSAISESSIEDIDLVETLTRYIEEGTDALRCLIAKFLVNFLAETSPLTSPQEIEPFVLSNSYSLTRCAWRLYDMHISEVNDLRMTLLLRVLVVDARPFEQLLQRYLDEEGPWEARFGAATQLFQIILDMTKPSFFVEGKQFRASVMETFFKFFSCMWSILSWDVIIETLIEDDFMQRTDADEGAISAHLSLYGIPSTVNPNIMGNKDPDVAVLQSSLILLSLQMIADGISIDLFSFLKIKLQLVVLLGFSAAILVPAPSGHSFHVHFGDLKAVSPYALPCLQGLMALLDSHRPFQLSPSAMATTNADDDTTYSVLVGSVVLDVFLDLFNHFAENLGNFTYLPTKTLLLSLVIVIYKHDIDSVPLQHLRDRLRKAVKGASDILLEDIGYELRQLALTALQAFRNRWSSYAGTRDILSYLVPNIIKLLSTSNSASDDVLLGQGMALLENILIFHPATFYYLSKQPLGAETFSVLRLVMARNARNYNTQNSLRDSILKDTLYILVTVPNDSGQKHVLENLQNYIDIVHNQGYTSDALTYIGHSFVNILRGASELTEEGFNPNPLLLSAATLIQYNKAQIRDFLRHMETAVRVALIRFNVDDLALRRLLQVTSTLYRRTASESTVFSNERNSLITVVIDILSDGLRGKCRVTSLTLKAMIDVLCSAKSTYLSYEIISRLGSDAFFYLQNSNVTDGNPQHGLDALKAACSLVSHAGCNDVGFLTRQLNDYAFEKHGRHTLTVRVWNILALEALEKSSAEKKKRRTSIRAFAHFLVHLQRVTAVSHTVLWDATGDDSVRYQPSFPWYQALASSLAQMFGGNRNASLVWNELWPAFERLVALSESDAEAGDVTPISTLLWSSVADIIMFLGILRSAISLEASSHIAVLNRIKNLGRGESFSGKFARTVKSISEPQPEMATVDLLAQASHELLAAEKLHALETKKEIGKMHSDRSRRDLRVPTG
ncbi:hypothetical protein EW145_g3377 [Phellinidium pouzarii]|uniref:Phorbol-ester/DAG-type domain-containing protein n=1 Tax=Phellinidium pouzarii TaxID=167371 RepID=A0A4S4L7R2_9AGAM|nr:hypothetical protein EW145_g3377 [Phellinidium pouzarii]